MNETNSFGNPDFPQDLKFVNDQLSATEPGSRQSAMRDMEGASSDLEPGGRHPSPGSDSRSGRPGHTFTINDMWATVLVTLVIGAALVLGTVVGWRLGWQKANLGLRGGTTNAWTAASAKVEQTDHTVPAAAELHPASASTDECGEGAVGGSPSQPPSGGLTICQGGRVIFRSPRSRVYPSRDLQSAQRPQGLQASPAQH